MALRLAALRRFCSKPVPLGLQSTSSVKASLENANVGPFFLLLFFTPTIYRSVKDFYWTRQLRKLNTEEIISDRYEWLRRNMIQDEVEEALLKKMPAGGIAALELGPSSPP